MVYFGCIKHLTHFQFTGRLTPPCTVATRVKIYCVNGSKCNPSYSRPSCLQRSKLKKQSKSDDKRVQSPFPTVSVLTIFMKQLLYT